MSMHDGLSCLQGNAGLRRAASAKVTSCLRHEMASSSSELCRQEGLHQKLVASG